MVGNSGYTPPLGRGFGKISVMKRPHTHILKQKLHCEG